MSKVDHTSRTYPDLIDQVTQLLRQGPQQFTTRQARMVADAVFAAILHIFSEPGVQKLVTPLGVFSLFNRQGYVGKHPRTGESITVEDKTVLKFRPSTAMVRTLALRQDTKVSLKPLYQKVSESRNLKIAQGEIDD